MTPRQLALVTVALTVLVEGRVPATFMIAIVGVLGVVGSVFAMHTALAKPKTAKPVEEKERPVGRVSAYNVEIARSEYMRREDMDGDDFESRLDELIENCAPFSGTDAEVIQASAAVCAQPSAGVIPAGMDAATYAQVLRQAVFGGLPPPSQMTAERYRDLGFPNTFGKPLEAIYEVGREEPVGYIDHGCSCGACERARTEAHVYPSLPLEASHE